MNRSKRLRESKPISCTIGLPAQTPHGRRFLPPALDEIARSNPNWLYATIPHGILSQGFHDITSREIATGIHFVAHWIHKTFGCSSNFEPLCYIGIPDLRSIAVFLAGVKCGYKVSNIFCKRSQSPLLLQPTTNLHQIFVPSPCGIQLQQIYLCLSRRHVLKSCISKSLCLLLLGSKQEDTILTV